MAPRASASDVTLQVGLLSVTGSLYPLASSPPAGGVRLTSVCPTCKDEGGISKTFTQHTCHAGHGPFEASEVLKATGSGKNLKVLATAEEVKEIRAESNQGPGKTCSLSAYPADLVASATFPISTPYVFATADNKNPAINLLRESISEDGSIDTEKGEVVLLGEVQLRTDAPAKLVTLRVREGQLLVQEIARPENMNEFDQPATKSVGEGLREQFGQLLAATVQDFDAEDLKATSVQKFAAFVTERIGEGVLALAPPTEEEAAEQDLESALASMLAAAKSK